MADKIYVTRDELNAIALAMGKLPKKLDERFTLKDGVAQISDTITDMLQKGYDHTDICDILKRNHGLEIKPATLKTYYRATLSGIDETAKRSSDRSTGRTDEVKSGSPKDIGSVPSADHGNSKFMPDRRL